MTVDAPSVRSASSRLTPNLLCLLESNNIARQYLRQRTNQRSYVPCLFLFSSACSHTEKSGGRSAHLSLQESRMSWTALLRDVSDRRPRSEQCWIRWPTNF